MGLGKRVIGWRVLLSGILGVLVSVLTIGLVGSVAFAGNWTGVNAGDEQVRFHQCELDLTGNTHESFHNNNDHDIEPTNINTWLYHGCDIVDVRIVGEAYGTDRPTGWYHCHIYRSSTSCDRGEVHVNTSYSNIPENYYRTLTLVCEEVGHSVGLDHRGDQDSCMSANLSAYHLDAHDKTVINNRY